MERFLSSKVEVWLVLLIVLLALILGGLWSFAVLQWRAFPYATVVEVRDFIRGDPDDRRSLWARLAAEVAYNPATFPASSDTELVPADQLSSVRAAPEAGGVMPDIDGMRFFSTGGDARYFVVFGSFAFPEQETPFGAIALDTNGVAHRGWAIRPDRFEYPGPHIGLAVTEDGLVATNAHGVLTGYDWCGDRRWQAPWKPHPDGVRRDFDAADGYDWHHDIVAQDGRLYTFRGPAIVTLDAATGSILSEIHAADLIRWSWRDDLSVFEARAKRAYNADTLSAEKLPGMFHFDPFHFNKVDILRAELAPAYPDFEAGDMLLSLRELNMVAVVRPSEKRVIWWRYGLVSRQHDATFVDGDIEVFDNNPVSVPPRPRIVRLDLDDHRAESVFDLSRWKMEMRSRGNFERRGNRLLTVDDYAGRVIAGQTDGSIDFLFENGRRDPDGEVVNLQLRDAIEIAPDTFARLQASCAK